jgi:hypothetical protein
MFLSCTYEDQEKHASMGFKNSLRYAEFQRMRLEPIYARGSALVGKEQNAPALRPPARVLELLKLSNCGRLVSAHSFRQPLDILNFKMKSSAGLCGMEDSSGDGNRIGLMLPLFGNCPIPLPKCRMIRHNSPMTPLLSDSSRVGKRIRRNYSVIYYGEIPSISR